MSSDEIGEALARNRPFSRMKDIDLDSFRFTTLFVDPPRSGLDTTTTALAGSFEQHHSYVFLQSANAAKCSSAAIDPPNWCGRSV